MNAHHDQLYRLAELPAFIEEALGNVSLKDIINAFLHKPSHQVAFEVGNSVRQYAETWVDDWMARHPESGWTEREDWADPEILAIEAGVELFSNPDCKAGLPE